MKIKIVIFSKDRDAGIKILEEHYLKLIKPFLSELEIICLKKDESSSSIPAITVIKKEEKEFLKYLSSANFNIALDANGKEFSSLEFSAKIRSWHDESKNLCFFIGGAFGLSPDLISACDIRLSLSKLTFPHDLARVVLLEQIYRAFTIINNKKYNY